MYSIIIVIKMSQLLSSQYTLVLIHDSNLNISQVAVYPVCQLRAVQNMVSIFPLTNQFIKTALITISLHLKEKPMRCAFFS